MHPTCKSIGIGALLTLGILTATAGSPPVAGSADDARVQAESGTGENWLINAGSARADHFSPLADIDTGNVARLGLAWHLEIPAPDGLAATPIVIDGVAYLSGPFAHVWAVDLHEGRIRWHFDPALQLGGSTSVLWGSRINRGVAVWHGKVVVGTGDCRLIALDAASGAVAWSRQVCDIAQGYKITGAPVVGGNLVFIGNAGSESGEKNRGYVTAHAIATGEEVWRFYTVPSGTPADEADPVMEMAAATWTGEAWKAYGGGGSVWDSMSYDPSTGLLVFGTAGALPYAHSVRSPGGGDNLFTESVVALNAATGQYAWHYQTVPGDSWEYNATMNVVFADLEVGGLKRPVAMIAPKNGFFYVLDRRTGEFLSGDAYTKVNWATGIDPETGRPVLSGAANYWERPGEKMLIWPNSWGAHSWNPMAYSPLTQLAYLPTIDLPDEAVYAGEGDYSTNVVWPAEVDGRKHAPSRLVAWDPRQRQPRWVVEHELPFNGGVLATAGGLVFQGTATGEIQAFDASTGERLWRHGTGSAISAAPVTYRLDGVQYLLVATGGGGGLRTVYPEWAASERALGPSRLMAYRLGGTAASPPPTLRRPLPEPPPLPAAATPELLARGEQLFHDYACMYCHGADARAYPGSTVPDLRYLDAASHLTWNGVVIGGARAARGMQAFDLTPQQAEDLRLWVLARAWEDYRAEAQP